MQPEKHRALGEKRRLGRVHIFAAFLFREKDAAAEGDHLGVVVADGKHDPSAKPVVKAGVGIFLVAGDHETAFDHLLDAEAAMVGKAVEGVEGIGGVSDFPCLGHFDADAALFEILAGGLRRRFLHQLQMEEVGSLGMERQEPAPQGVTGGILGAHLAFGDRDVDPGGQFFDRAHEVDLLVIHHEAKDASPGAAAEAFETLALGIDREGRCLLVVKRAERLEDAGRPFEVESVPGDHLDDIVGALDLFDRFGRDLRHGTKSKSRPPGLINDGAAGGPSKPGLGGAVFFSDK